MLNNSIDELSASRVKNRFVVRFTSSIASSIAAVRFNILHSGERQKPSDPNKAEKNQRSVGRKLNRD
jgi:hypothetical protein